jgi:2'-5' RNA ligase
MAHAIVLFFDPSSCQRVEDLRNRISKAAGFPAPANNRWLPHLTLAIFQTLEKIEPAVRIMDLFSRTIAPFEVVLESIGWFPTPEEVMFLSPVVTRELLDVHDSLHRLLEEGGLTSQPYYRPGMWVPHCTILTGLPPSASPEVLDEVLRSKVFGRVALTEVGLVEFDPINYLSTFPLAGNHGDS